jgi:hypothetical protein
MPMQTTCLVDLCSKEDILKTNFSLEIGESRRLFSSLPPDSTLQWAATQTMWAATR